MCEFAHSNKFTGFQLCVAVVAEVFIAQILIQELFFPFYLGPVVPLEPVVTCSDVSAETLDAILELMVEHRDELLSRISDKERQVARVKRLEELMCQPNIDTQTEVRALLWKQNYSYTHVPLHHTSTYTHVPLHLTSTYTPITLLSPHQSHLSHISPLHILLILTLQSH